MWQQLRIAVYLTLTYHQVARDWSHAFPRAEPLSRRRYARMLMDARDDDRADFHAWYH
jgi:hypothetical protein